MTPTTSSSASSPNGETDMNDIDIEEGRRLAAEATAGSWKVYARDVGWGSMVTDAQQEMSLGFELDGPPEPLLRGQLAKYADAALIVWLHNNAAAMFDAIETGRQWETIARQVQADAEQLRTAAKAASRLIQKGLRYCPIHEFSEAKQILDHAAPPCPRRPDPHPDGRRVVNGETDMNDIDIDDMRALAAAGTPLPWFTPDGATVDVGTLLDAIETGRKWETIARQAQADAERLTTSLDIFFDQAKGMRGPERGRLAHALLRDFRRILARQRSGDVKRHCVRGRDDGWWQCVDCDEAFPTWPDDFVPCPGKQS